MKCNAPPPVDPVDNAVTGNSKCRCLTPHCGESTKLCDYCREEMETWGKSSDGTDKLWENVTSAILNSKLSRGEVRFAGQALDRLRAAHEEQAREVLRLNKEIRDLKLELISSHGENHALLERVNSLSPHAKESKS